MSAVLSIVIISGGSRIISVARLVTEPLAQRILIAIASYARAEPLSQTLTASQRGTRVWLFGTGRVWPSYFPPLHSIYDTAFDDATLISKGISD